MRPHFGATEELEQARYDSHEQLRLYGPPAARRRITAFLSSPEFSQHLRWVVNQTHQTGNEHAVNSETGVFIERVRGHPDSMGGAKGSSSELKHDSDHEHSDCPPLSFHSHFVETGISDSLASHAPSYNDLKGNLGTVSGHVVVDPRLLRAVFVFYFHPLDAHSLKHVLSPKFKVHSDAALDLPYKSPRQIRDFLSQVGIVSHVFSVPLKTLDSPSWKMPARHSAKLVKLWHQNAQKALERSSRLLERIRNP